MRLLQRAGRHDHNATRLERVFDTCFFEEFNTRLVGGASEPLYQPVSPGQSNHIVYYRHDYFASALHEAAHWCIAGKARRQKLDFGYWYSEDERSLAMQRAFELVEYKPQALEWIFSEACNWRFQVSLDNLALCSKMALDGDEFKANILKQALTWRDVGLPERAARFYSALCVEFNNDQPLQQLKVTLVDLD